MSKTEYRAVLGHLRADPSVSLFCGPCNHHLGLVFAHRDYPNDGRLVYHPQPDNADAGQGHTIEGDFRVSCPQCGAVRVVDVRRLRKRADEQRSKAPIIRLTG